MEIPDEGKSYCFDVGVCQVVLEAPVMIFNSYHTVHRHNILPPARCPLAAVIVLLLVLHCASPNMVLTAPEYTSA